MVEGRIGPGDPVLVDGGEDIPQFIGQKPQLDTVGRRGVGVQLHPCALEILNPQSCVSGVVARSGEWIAKDLETAASIEEIEEDATDVVLGLWEEATGAAGLLSPGSRTAGQDHGHGNNQEHHR